MQPTGPGSKKGRERGPLLWPDMRPCYRALFMADPKYRELRRKSMAMELKSRFGPLIAKLGLPPDEVQRLGALAVDRRMQIATDLWTAATAERRPSGTRRSGGSR